MAGLRLNTKDEIPLYLYVSVLLAVGVIFGALLVNALTLEQKQDLSQFMGSFIHALQASDHSGGDGGTFLQVFMVHLKWIGLIFILGLSVIGLPGVLVLDFLKGVLIGFSVGFMVGQLSWKGMLFALVSVAPQNLFIIPAIVIASVASLSFSIFVVKNRLLQQKGRLNEPFSQLLFTMATMTAVLAVSAVFEIYISPIMMRWVTPMLTV